MKLEQLRYVLEIEKNKSIGKASRNLFLTQQSLSHSIKSLENELGIVIFDRLSSGVVLTKEGEKLSNFAKKVLKEFDNLQMELEAIKNAEGEKIEGSLTIYLNKIFETLIFPEVLVKFCKRYPHILIRTKQTSIDDNARKENFICMINFPRTKEKIIYPEPKNDFYKFQTLFEGKFIICLNKEHPLAKQKTALPLRLALKYPLIIHGPSPYKGSMLEAMVHQYGNYPVKVNLETTSYGIWLDAIAEGIGIGFLYDRIMDKLEKLYPESFENIVVLQAKEYMGISTGFITRKGELNLEEELFVKFLQEQFPNTLEHIT